MWDTVVYWVEFVTKSSSLFYVTIAFLCILGLFLIYLFIALVIHRKDRKELESIAISRGVDVIFKYNWKGVELEIRHPTRTPTQGNQPPSPPFLNKEAPLPKGPPALEEKEVSETGKKERW